MEENYVELLLQKYRLAVVLAVLRNKPNNISIEDYVMELRNNIRETEEISIDEDDFNMSDDEIHLNTLSLNIDDNSNGSVTILQDFQNILDDEKNPNSVTSQTITSPTQPNIQNVEFATIDKELREKVESNLSKIQVNQSQSILTNIDLVSGCTQNCTHISQSQDCISVNSNFLKSDKTDVKRKNETELSALDNKDDSEIQVYVRKKIKPIVYTESVCTDVTDLNTANTPDTQYETPKVMHDNEELNTAQIDLFHVNAKPIEKTNSINKIIILDDVPIKAIDMNCSKETHLSDTNFESHNTQNSIQLKMLDTERDNSNGVFNLISQDILTCESTGVNCTKNYDSQKSSFKYENKLIYLENKSDSLYNLENVEEKNSDVDLNEHTNKDNVTHSNNNQISTENLRIIDSELHSDEDLTGSEIIPFKVMGELNKIKTYLNNDFGDSHSDSGFRSRSSTYMASQSTHWLNQSSHCLFAYLSQAQLFDSTVEIDSEISKVLGEVIDRLYENEICPSFLEEMLEFIANLISTIYEGKCDFFKTEETIERLLLLNKSQNIIQFTIDKIIKTLELFCEHLGKDTMIELTNIDRTENLAYIFQLLEALLKKRIKISQSTKFSQNSNFSQSQESLPKRSTITEIWRRKWNLTKEEVFQKEEKNILVDCSDVLKKIIVKAMTNYSLIAFAALQCFNLLQS